MIVETTYGKIRGREREGVQIFAGIPYGEDCGGRNRFLPAAPVKGWHGVKDCTKNGFYAMQPATGVCASPMYGDYFSGGHPERFGVLDEVQSEDCLCLNVMTPGADDRRRPVLVYFHGGGLAVGNGSIVLGADRFVKEQDIVVVGVNHRLNVFGYLYLGEFDEQYKSSGLAGILDLALALRWVRDNIVAFGGDPEKVTIMGESGGGVKVNCLLNMPETKGLFRYAIIESGARPLCDNREEAAGITRQIFAALSLKPGDIAGLCEIPAERLLEAALPYLMQLRPVADGIHLTAGGEEAYLTEAYQGQIPLMLGCSEDECAIDWAPYEITDENLRDWIQDLKKRPPMASQTRIYAKDQLDRMIESVRKSSERRPTVKTPTAEELFWRISSVAQIGDIGTYHMAMERTAKHTAPVWLYLNRFDAPHWMEPKKKFSWHTFDLPLQLGIVRHPECEEISARMREAWGSFIRDGVPSVAGLQWPEFDRKKQKTMIFDDTCYIEEKPMETLVKLAEAEDPVILTAGGRIQGIRRDGVALFRGIPYGDRCDGEHRFLPPRPAPSWEGILDCTKNGPLAIQPGNAGEKLPDYFTAGEPEKFGVEGIGGGVLNVADGSEQKGTLQSENCLTVNVLTPGLDQKKRPVLVYIHGGGFTTGSGTITFGADRFSKEHDIVVCSLHHRLNVFGFLYLGAFDKAYESSGMAGMLDLVLGLRWIHENIAAFGGDPKKVTIMGESGGGMKLCTLLNMPETRGLYRGAIIESGSAKSGMDKRADAAETARGILQRLEIGEHEIDKLKDVPARELLAAAEPYMDSFSPVADDVHLKICEPGYAIDDLAGEIPIIVGSSEDEMQAMCFDMKRPVITRENLTAELTEYLNSHREGGLPEYTQEKVRAIIRVYQKYAKDDPEQLYWFIASFSGFLGNGAYFYARERAGQGGAPVYAYFNAFDAPVIGDPQKRFSWHVSDLPLQLHIVNHPECEEISRFWSDAWSAFVKTGNPSTDGQEWPAYNAGDRPLLIADKTIKVVKDYRGELWRALSLTE